MSSVADIPIQLQSALNMASMHLKITYLREDLLSLDAKLQSGQYGMKRVLSEWLQEWYAILDEAITIIEGTIIPKDKWTDFEAGTVTLDEYGDTDSIEYYNGLRKLRMIGTQLEVALISLQDTKPRALSPYSNQQSGIIGVLTEEEFIDQGAITPTTEVEDQYIHYTIDYGDSLMRIAKKVYNDYSLWTEISRANDLYDSDLIDNNMAGQTIKIPIEQKGVTKRQAENLVYEPVFKGTDQKDIDRYFFGRDIKLEDKKIVVDGQNDLAVMEGVECAVENIRDRFASTRGSLNPQNPTWGLTPIDFKGGMPFAIFLEKLFLDMEGQAMFDPRTSFASVLRSKLFLEGDTFKVDMTINLIGGRTGKLTLTDPHKAVL